MEPVSVIITCYNLERYIGETIQSVIDQDYPGPIEILVVDDCSADASRQIIASFPQVTYLRTDVNGGVLLAMIAGLKAARNDLICLLDGDDLWMPDKVRKVAEAFAVNPRLVFATHDILYVDEHGRPLPIPSRPARRMPDIPGDKISDTMRQASLAMDDFICLGSAMTIRRSLADLDGFYAFVEQLPDPANTYQDWPLVAWMSVLEGREFGYIPKALYKYRIHGGNHSGDASSVPKATRNLTRTFNSLDAMISIARTARADPAIVRLLAQRKRAIRYLRDLMAGSDRTPIRSFASAIPDFRRRGLIIKEAIRLASVLVLGRERFLRLSSRRKVFRFIKST